VIYGRNLTGDGANWFTVALQSGSAVFAHVLIAKLVPTDRTPFARTSTKMR
jgi:hypothetical protein